MRCLALAQAWQDAGGTVSLAVAELPDALSPRVPAEGVTLSRIDATPGGSEDAAETIAQAHRLSADWVVIDGDRFGSDFLETVRAAGFRVLLIDDFAGRKSFPADLIVNPDLDDGEPYRKRGATARLLMGPPYVLLRREFRQETERKEIRQTGNRILVTLGGSDPENLTPRIANALAHCSDLEVTLIAGAGYDKANELRKLRASNLRVVFNPPNMAQFMKDSDQAIIAMGGTLWELLSMGCAVLSYSRNDVQAVSYTHLDVYKRQVRESVVPSWHLYPVRLKLEMLAAGRGEIFRALRAENIGVNVHYIPVPQHPYYRERFKSQSKEGYPVAEDAYERLISLPMFHSMAARDVEDAIHAVRKVLGHYSG